LRESCRTDDDAPDEFGVQSRIEDEDYLQGLAAIRKGWYA
jgi:hypothetical protein